MIRELEKLQSRYPYNDRRLDFDTEELTGIDLTARLKEKINEVIDFLNGWNAGLNGKEDSVNITNNRKLSPTGDFTGSIWGKDTLSMLAQMDTTRDMYQYLANQFSDGHTGWVIDCGFFEDTKIKKNYDGGIF